MTADEYASSARRSAYSHLLNDHPERVRVVAPMHAARWKALGLTHYQGGPFEDRSGGLVTFADDPVDVRNTPYERIRSSAQARGGGLAQQCKPQLAYPMPTPSEASLRRRHRVR